MCASYSGFRFQQRLWSMLLAFALTASLVPPAMASDQPVISDNVGKCTYAAYSKPITSYLFENAKGGLTRVEYIKNQVVAEDYSSDFVFQGSRTISLELPLWGGFFAGKDFNFFVFGQENPEESDSVEVIRVVKYSKDWQRLGQASLYGANTTVPFDAGSLRMTESGNMLYVHTSHEMYVLPDGINHQANLAFAVRQSDMVLTNSLHLKTSIGYVSHSFNQFILVDQSQRIVTVNHGDAYPRSIVLTACKTSADGEKFSVPVSSAAIQKIPGKTGDNTTGTSVGGLAETSDGYVVSYNFDGKGNIGKRTVYLGFVDKSTLSVTNVSIPSTDGGSTPVLAPTGLSGGYILWNKNSALYYAPYSADGSVGAVSKADSIYLSDCQPICYQGKVVWYTTNNCAPIFYVLDGSGVAAFGEKPESTKPAQPGSETTSTDPSSSVTPGTFTDVPSGSWYHDAVYDMVERGAVEGVGGNRFDPNGTVSDAQYFTMLTRLFYAGEVAAQGTGGKWFTAAMEVARKNSLIVHTTAGDAYQNGVWNEALLNAGTNRYIVAQATYNFMKAKGILPTAMEWESAQARIPDYNSIPTLYRNAVCAVYAAGYLEGVDSSGRFAGSMSLSRAQAVTVLYRLITGIENGTGNTGDEGNTGSAPNTSSTPQPTLSQAEMIEKLREQEWDGTARAYDALQDRVNREHPYTPPAVPETTYKPGYLANGQPISDVNIQSALLQLKQRFPTGLKWDESDAYDYHSPKFGRGGGCNAFAYMISDLVFGTDAPLYVHQDFSTVKVGDVIWWKNSKNGYSHVVVVYQIEDGVTYDCSGNSGDAVDWHGIGELRDLNSECYVYSRYPTPAGYSVDMGPEPSDIICGVCGFVMQKAGSSDFNANGGNSFKVCDICHDFFACHQCMDSQTYKEHVAHCHG